MQGASTPLACLVAAASGPLPAHHPASLRRMLLLRQTGAAAVTLRALLSKLTQEGSPQHVRSRHAFAAAA